MTNGSDNPPVCVMAAYSSWGGKASHLVARIALVLIMFAGYASVGSALELRGTAQVVDGDTVKIDGMAIRLHGIDAPETAQQCKDRNGVEYACGESASRRLRQLASGKIVICTGNQFDAYRRLIGTCLADGVDLNRTMVAEGHAWAFVKYSSDYVATEAEARKEKRGVFAVGNTLPWDFRSGAWRATQQHGAPGADQACPIKGNVSRNGERIYHMPWQKDYFRVRMDGHAEKRWFCDENEAVGAGWRKAAR